jgi:hypothetical protein
VAGTRKENSVTSRFIIQASIVFTLACLSAPIAAAGGWAPPGQAGSFDGRSPDTKDAALAAHRQGRILSATKIVAAWPPINAIGYDGRSPDTKDAALAAHQNRGTEITAGSTQPLVAGSFDGRSPDTKDAAYAAHNPAATIVIASGGGFDWTDAGIGAAAGFGLAVMLAAGFALTRKDTSIAAS